VSEHLEKAKGALGVARTIAERAEGGPSYSTWPIAEADDFHRQMYVALVQANIAQAEALERLVERLDGMLPS
jgi:hypothetical protein